MKGTRRPGKNLFPHTIDHYTAAFTKDTSGAKVPAYTLANQSVIAFCQPAVSDVVAQYAQINETVSYSVYLWDVTAFDSIGIEDRIVYDGSNYTVRGKRNACDLDRLGRIDCDIEPS